jgi:Uma2 family endonuclease
MDTKTLLTTGEYEQLPEQEGKIFELNEGELTVMSPVYFYHPGIDATILSENEVLEDEKLLPGLCRPIRELFA